MYEFMRANGVGESEQTGLLADADMSHQKMLSLERDLQQLQKDHQQLQKDHQQLQNDYQQLQKDHQQLQKDHQQLQKDHQQLKNDYQQLQNDYQQLQNEREVEARAKDDVHRALQNLLYEPFSEYRSGFEMHRILYGN
jgi:predicted nuclease with TOPRIM domain